MRLAPGQPVIVEGIHALNDKLTCDVPKDRKFQIYVSVCTTINLDDHNRVQHHRRAAARRMVGTHSSGARRQETNGYVGFGAQRGTQLHLPLPRSGRTLMFNSTLLYELAVLKKYAYPMLLDIQPDSPHYTRAHRLIKFLNYVQSADVEDEIPINSILREFIGGCCFYREED